MGLRRVPRSRRRFRPTPFSRSAAIEALENRALLAAFSVTNASDAGSGSLRDAIDRANARVGSDSIVFDLPGEFGEVRTIALASPLPQISDRVSILGYSQKGSVPNSAKTGTNAQICLVLDGSSITDEGASGLRIAASDVVIQGLVISGFAQGAAIQIDSGANTRVEGCFLGTDADGSNAIPNEVGVLVNGPQSRIGSTNIAHRNLIAGNSRQAVRIEPGGTGTRLFNNLIGVNSDLGPLGNGADGVLVSASAVQVGDSATNAPNVIANNTGAGVAIIADVVQTRVLSNEIYSNGGLAIDLGLDGVTHNDDSDSDTGPNGLLNYPFLTSVTFDGAQTKLAGSYSGTPLASIRVQVFDTGSPIDDSGFGEGATLLADRFVNTNAQGNADFEISIPGLIADGHALAATATDSAGNTSEFSSAISLRSDVRVDLTQDLETVFVGQPLTYTVTVLNQGPAPVARVDVSGNLPAGVEFLNVIGGPDHWVIENQRLTVTLENLAAGTPISFQIQAKPLASAQSSIIFVVSALGSRPDPVGANNLASITTTVVPAVDIEVVATPPNPQPALEARDLTFTYVVRNLGPSTATEIQLALDTPAFAQYKSASASQGEVSLDANTILANLGTLLVGESATVTIIVLPTHEAIGTSIVSQAAVTRAQADLVATNDTASASAPVVHGADLSATFAPLPSNILFGDTIRTTVTIENHGPNEAPATILAVPIPQGLELVSAAYSNLSRPVEVSGGTIRVLVGVFQAGDTGQLDLTLRANAPAVYALNAEISTTTYDYVDENNDDLAVAVVVPAADLDVKVTASSNSALLGQGVEYLLQLENKGPSVAENVTLALGGAGIRVLGAFSAFGDPIVTDDTATLELGTLPVGVLKVLRVTAAPVASGIQPVVARAASTTADPNANNHVIASSLEGLPHADLAIKIETLTDPENFDMPVGLVGLGQVFTHVLTITNQGPSVANDVILTNVLPFLSTMVSVETSGAPPTQVGQVLTFALGTIEVGESRQVTIQARASGLGTLTNTASVQSKRPDLNTVNSTAVEARLESVSPGTIQFGSPTYLTTESDSLVQIEVTRSEGANGTVRVDFSTFSDSATAGYDYLDLNKTLEFRNGVTSQIVQIRLVNDAEVEPVESILLQLANPTAGAKLGAQKSAVVSITDNDTAPQKPTPPPDRKAPRVAFLDRSGLGRGPARLVIHFDEPIPLARATDRRGFQLWSAGPDRKFGTKDDSQVPVYPPLYDPSTNAVLLRTFLPLPTNTDTRLVVYGNGSFAVRDAAGNALDGDGNGKAGGNFVAIVKQTTTRVTRRRGRKR